MKIACVAAGLFSFAFFLHWIVWRIKIPSRQTAALLLILLGVLPVGLVAIGVLPRLQSFAPVGFWEYLHVSIFHVAMSLAYVVAYSALEQRSPSMTVLVFVAASRRQGRTREELVDLLKGMLPVEARLDAMLRDGMLADVNDIYQLTAKGRLWDYCFAAWRRLTKLSKGG
jgi:hypothetical protein